MHTYFVSTDMRVCEGYAAIFVLFLFLEEEEEEMYASIYRQFS